VREVLRSLAKRKQHLEGKTAPQHQSLIRMFDILTRASC
jgi:hypothetical protein